MALFDKIGNVLTTDLTKEFKLKKKEKDEDEGTKPTWMELLSRCRQAELLGQRVHFSQSYLSELIQFSVRNCPSLYEECSTRIVILYSESHRRLWEIIREVQRRELPAHIFDSAAIKIDECEASYGTVLFYEDQQVIKHLQKNMPFHVDDYPAWSEQTSGMSQYAVWTALASAGLGGHLHQYKNIEKSIANYFALNDQWQLKAQLVFGSIENVYKTPVQRTEDENLFNIFV